MSIIEGRKMLREAMLYKTMDGMKVNCLLCNHRCRIANSSFGICQVRENREGVLYTLAYGKAIAIHIDPIEKKPLYHFLPGTASFSIGAAGCNFQCGFCQNWQISQITKMPDMRGYELTPEEIVAMAQKEKCQSISYTYTEPTIFFEYAYDTAKLARERGLSNIFVTNGYMTPEALRAINPYLDACNVDLKSFREEFYKKVCHGQLHPVLDSIRLMKKLDIWVEITTLVVPDENDDEEELADIARFIAGIDPGIPWHISRFHPDYEFTNSIATPLDTLQKTYSIGKREGLEFVYMGNVRGQSEDTTCPRCKATLIKRHDFLIEKNRVEKSRCPSCGARIAGIFTVQEKVPLSEVHCCGKIMEILD
jgi:pyruvate formate lyase activating enzyme